MKLGTIWAWVTAMRVLRSTETNLALWEEVFQRLEREFVTMALRAGN
jgi:hypothetical protein